MNWTEEQLAAYIARQQGQVPRIPRPTLAPDAMARESSFQAAVIDAAKALGWMAYHTHDSRRSMPGFPDLILAKPGMRLLCIELKTNHGRLSPDQETWVDLLNQVQQPIAEVWRPADWQRLLGSLGYT
jgi:hypothetical protein